MNKWIKKYWPWAVTAVLFIIGGPIIINELYKTGKGYLTLWGAADVLSYYGTLLGAVATIVAVVLTIRFTKKQQMEEHCIAAKPFLTSETILLNSNEEIWLLENGQTLYIFPYNDLWGVSTSTDVRIRKNIHQVNKEDCAIKYALTNIGGNSATNIRMCLNGKPLIPDYGIGKDKEKVFVFLLKLNEGEELSRYDLTFEYGDIVSETRFIQKETLIIKKDDPGITFCQGTNELLTNPVTKEDTNHADT